MEVIDVKVRMKPMDKEVCPRSICSETGWITKEYQNIVCLPNKIIVEFENKGVESIDSFS